MKTIAIIGLGYVGLPLAYHLAKKGNNLIGFDISEQKLAESLGLKLSTIINWQKNGISKIALTN